MLAIAFLMLSVFSFNVFLTSLYFFIAPGIFKRYLVILSLSSTNSFIVPTIPRVFSLNLAFSTNLHNWTAASYFLTSVLELISTPFLPLIFTESLPSTLEPSILTLLSAVIEMFLPFMLLSFSVVSTELVVLCSTLYSLFELADIPSLPKLTLALTFTLCISLSLCSVFVVFLLVISTFSPCILTVLPSTSEPSILVFLVALICTSSPCICDLLLLSSTLCPLVFLYTSISTLALISFFCTPPE